MSTTWSLNSGGGGGAGAGSGGPPTHQFSFPILTADDIVGCLGNLQIPFSVEQLKAPTPEAVRPLFESLLVILRGVSKDDLAQPRFGATDVLSFPELHEDSIPVLALHRELSVLFEAAGYMEFGLRDFMSPEYPRLRKALSAVINFAKFREGRLQAFADLSAGSEKLAVRRAALIEKSNTLERAVFKLRDAKLKDKPEIDSLENSNREYRNQIALLRETEDRLRAEIHSTKKQATQLAAENSSLKDRVELESQEIEYCQAQVVQSPDRVKRDLADQTEQLQADRRVIAGVEARTRELRARFKALDTCKADVRIVCKLMRECSVEQTTLRKLQGEIETKQQALLDLKGESDRVNDSYTHLHKQMRSTEERHQRLESQGDARNGEAQTDLANKEQEKKQALTERQRNEQIVKSNNSRTAELQEKIAALMAEHGKHIRRCLQLQQNLSSAVEQHRLVVMDALANV